METLGTSQTYTNDPLTSTGTLYTGTVKESFPKKDEINFMAQETLEEVAEQIYNEESECVNMYLDDLNIPRKSEDGKEYSIVGRIKQLEKRYLKELSEVENHYLQQLNK